jgi:HSP20 family protein
MAGIKEGPKPTTEAAKGQSKEITARRAAPAPAHWSNPFEYMRRVAEEMDSLFGDFGFGHRMPTALTRGREMLRREAGLIPAEWSPRVEILEKDGHILVRAELPGMSKEDVKVEITDDALTIHGERKQEKKEEREGYYYNERSFGSFYRRLPLPEGVDTSKAAANFRNGVLEVTMPVPTVPKPQTRQIDVREEK